MERMVGRQHPIAMWSIVSRAEVLREPSIVEKVNWSLQEERGESESMGKWKPTRKFSDGKFFQYQVIPHKDKPRAKRIAAHVRREGDKARVTAYKHGYIVWHKGK
jgi:type IV secretory pathway VirB9-like protein